MRANRKHFAMTKGGTWKINIVPFAGSVDYVVGDLCYVLPRKEWERMCDDKFPEGWEHTEYWGTEGNGYAMHDTHSGDGVFKGETNSYPVDSGSIGIARADACDKRKLSKALKEGLVHKFNLHGQVELRYDDGGDCHGETGNFEIWANGYLIETIKTGA